MKNRNRTTLPRIQIDALELGGKFYVTVMRDNPPGIATYDAKSLEDAERLRDEIADEILTKGLSEREFRDISGGFNTTFL